MIDTDAISRSLRQEFEESEYERRCLGEAAKLAAKIFAKLREPCADERNCCERCARVGEELGR